MTHKSLSTMNLSTLASVALLAFAGACGAQQEPTVTDKPRTPEPAATRAATSKPTRTGYAEINGINYYYEVHGQGEPLLILHGGLGSIDMFDPVLPILAAKRQVIGVDLHGHGRTELGDRKMSAIDMGDDLAVLVDRLGHAQVDVLGYSLGGAVALRLAIQHPERVRRLAIASFGFARDGFYPEMLPMQAQVSAAIADTMKDTPMYKSYVAVAPRPADFPRLLDRVGELMRTPYNWAEEVKKLKMPVILVYGDSDMFRLDHVFEFYRLLGGGQRDAGWMREHMVQNRLAILPDVTHYEMFMSPALPATVLPFLDGKRGPQSWAAQVAQQ
jgi:pimeloyl-ACP methyl ester carboxylesterase